MGKKEKQQTKKKKHLEALKLSWKKKKVRFPLQRFAKAGELWYLPLLCTLEKKPKQKKTQSLMHNCCAHYCHGNRQDN